MTKSGSELISVVVPLYNEADGLGSFHKSLLNNIQKVAKDDYEIIYCDDGSSDNSAELVRQFRHDDSRIKLISFSRNFGKESALSAGIAAANGKAIITLDGDGQHPVELLPEFVKAWQGGAQVVVGICINRRSDSWLKRLGSRLFYSVFNRLTGQKLLPGMTDFRLMDRAVQKAFVDLPEIDRVTRGLIDWLGFRRAQVEYEENARKSGTPGYNLSSLTRLAANSFVSLTPVPLYLFGWLGVLITLGSFLLGSAVIIEQLLLGDPWHWKFTGTAMLSIMLLFLVGVILLSQGILSLYISHIHSQSKGRPLFVIDYNASAGISEPGGQHAS